jgi:CheY-like chemotaxis protein
MSTVLIIDDDKINNFICESLIITCSPENKPLSITNAYEGLDYIAKNASDIHYLLLDLILKEMDGFQFIEELNARNIKYNFPIYMISSSIDAEDITKSKNVPQIKKYLIKPLRKIDIIEINKELLENFSY